LKENLGRRTLALAFLELLGVTIFGVDERV